MADSYYFGLPIAYLITFRCYGTWLHGDKRGAMDRREHNIYGTERMLPNPALKQTEFNQLKHPPFTLNAAQRKTTEDAIEEVCAHRRYLLRAVSVRTNHVHILVSGVCKPEHMMNAFKSYSTRKMRQLGLILADVRPWERHGSTKYLWKEQDVQRAIEYVLYEQGDELREF